ncbi:DUF4062 domain-containing protein [Mycobacterium sp. BMJ-28]
MEIRHQVFVSSTYVDLIEERQAIIQALLELECIPAGMELFVATDQDQWDLIKGVIDLSDYYLLIIGARYGHVTDENISYTEKEYNYAVECDKPIIAFVHANPDSVPQGVTDKDIEKAKKLDEFRARVRNGSDGKRRNVGEFKTADELAAKVSRAISNAMRKYPGVGWVRGDQAMTVEKQQEIIDLKQRITTLETEKLAAEKSLVEDVEELAQGPGEITLRLYVSDTSFPAKERAETFYVKARTTWDALFKSVGPLMIDEATELEVRKRLRRHLWSTNCLSDEDVETIRGLDYSMDYDVLENSWDLVQLQLRSLNLVDTGVKRRELKDYNKYLGLTQKGQRHLMRLRAVRKGVDPGADNYVSEDREGEEDPDDE